MSPCQQFNLIMLSSHSTSPVLVVTMKTISLMDRTRDVIFSPQMNSEYSSITELFIVLLATAAYLDVLESLYPVSTSRSAYKLTSWTIQFEPSIRITCNEIFDNPYATQCFSGLLHPMYIQGCKQN